MAYPKAKLERFNTLAAHQKVCLALGPHLNMQPHTTVTKLGRGRMPGSGRKELILLQESHAYECWKGCPWASILRSLSWSNQNRRYRLKNG